MNKIIDPCGWNFDRPIAMEIPISSRGLINNDRRDFMKLAGVSHAFLKQLDNIKVAKDEVPIHLVAMGATEAWGPNRNGDGFKEAMLRERHDTFVKHAKWFRNHKNRVESDPHYGYVKASGYNDEMRWVELLTMLNGSKSAAERNGGYVADKELEKLAQGKDLAVSMACRVPYDVCSGCENKARTRADYCTESTCKRGGCRHNLAKVADDGHILHVDNPNASFFDISDVFRPADRIAYGASADYLQKAASHAFMCGAELADALGIVAPWKVCQSCGDDLRHWNPNIEGQLKLAHALAMTESHTLDTTTRYRLMAFDSRVQPALSDAELSVLGTPGTEKCAAALAALADNKIILPLGDFARWLGKQAADIVAASQLLPAVYRQLVGGGELEHKLLHNSFTCNPGSTKVAGIAQRKLADDIRSTHSLDVAYVDDRVMRCSLRGGALPSVNLKSGFWNEKVAGEAVDAVQLAEQYALYKLASLYRIAGADSSFSLTACLAIGQNKIS